MNLKDFLKKEAKDDVKTYGDFCELDNEEKEAEFLKRVVKGFIYSYNDYTGIPENIGQTLRSNIPKSAGKYITVISLDLYCIYFSEENKKRWEFLA
jgi:hypothetical protein